MAEARAGARVARASSPASSPAGPGAVSAPTRDGTSSN